MKKFDTFKIKSYAFDDKTLKAVFRFSFDDECFFSEEIDFSCPWFIIKKDIDSEVLDWLLFHSCIALAISYYKLNPTKEIVLEHWFLDHEQKDFRRKFYINWLGEYFFKNKISPLSLCNFVNTQTQDIVYKKFNSNAKKALITLGGGKDSLLASELFQEFNIDFDTCTFWKDYILHRSVSQEIWAPRLLIRRNMDTQLFEMNTQWYYNGHVPITGIIAFILEIAAYLYDYRYIVLANEKSADEPNTYMDWIAINHQYSKSLEFEKDFDWYVGTYISDDVKYFSLLRWMYEIFIAQEFVKYWKYFDVFSSCNNNFKIIEQHKTTDNRWCCACPKCAFVYSIFRPFLDADQTEIIFWKELYEDIWLEILFKELLWISWIKPFECVWTNEEVILAMYLYYKQLKLHWRLIPYIIDIFQKEVLSKMNEEDFRALEKKLLHLRIDQDYIPQDIKQLLVLKYH